MFVSDKIFTNQEIYTYATKLVEVFKNKEQVLPLKLNYWLHRNMKTMSLLAEEIEYQHYEIINRYMKYDEEAERGYFETEDDEAAATNKIQEVLQLERKVQIFMLSIDDLDPNFELSIELMEALMFMFY